MRGSSHCKAALKGCLNGATAMASIGRPFVAPAFSPADGRRAALKACAAVVVAALFAASATAAADDLRLIDAVKQKDVDAVRALLAPRRPPIDVNAAAGD